MPYKTETLEQSDPQTPDLKKIILELQESFADVATYGSRVNQARAWWMCEWAGQTTDGRSWPMNESHKIYPWKGCSDSRLRIVNTIVQEHVTLCLAAFWSAKKQAKSIRPFVSGREVNMTQRMLDWRLEMMKRELLSELPMALSWRFGFGLSFLKIEWEQMREVIYVPLTMQMIGELSAALGLPDVTGRILDPDKAYDSELITVLQHFSQILPTDEARTILTDLRNKGQSQLPITSLRINKPKWTARRPFLDVMFPSETCDIQVTRFTNERELVSETELEDRIVDDGYDPDFVTELLNHKGEFADWHQPMLNPASSDRNLFELNHFLSWRIHEHTPCLYRTVFSQPVAQSTRGELYAIHRKFEYDHGQFPFVALRRTYLYRPLLSSIGIAEESYTDEYDIKRQQDGLNDRSELIHQPPMILPTSRAQAWAGQYGPRAVMIATRPESVIFPPLPPIDQTPIQVIMMVQQRLDRRYPITGGEVDPEIKALWRQHLTDTVNSELDLALDQTRQLMWQFESDEDIKAVAGGDPWEYSRQDIQKSCTVTTAIDINLIDIERATMKLDMFAKILPFRESGGMVFNSMMQILDPDLADQLTADQASPAAMQKEQDAEYAAMGQIMSGIEPPYPQGAMNQTRLQVINQVVSQPQVMQKYQQDPVIKKLVDQRVKFFMNTIQQFQNNPQIGRTLAPSASNPPQPAPVTQPTQ